MLLSLVVAVTTCGFVAVIAGAATPVTLYVTEGGSNTGNCNTTASPCATVTYALSQVPAGATSISVEVSGTIDDHVTVGGAVPVTITGASAPKSSPAALDGTQTGRVVYDGEGTLSLDDLTVENGDTAGPGGGIDSYFGALTVANSTISGNTGAGGGGIATYGGTFTMTNSTVSGNTTSTFAGGIYRTEGVVTTITDSTIAWNTAPANEGGGIYNNGTNSGTNIGASIISNNKGGNCAGSALTSVGYNLTDDTTGTACGFTTLTDQVNANPALSATLANNGGLTDTLLPGPASQAIGVIPDPTTLNTPAVPVCGPGALDQRGFSRPRTGTINCTIGAVEDAVATTTTTTVSTLPSTTAPGGTRVVYVASVEPVVGSGTPAGSVTFKIGSTMLCTAPLTGGAGACGATNAPTGKDKVVGTYKGSGIYTGSVGKATLTVTG